MGVPGQRGPMLDARKQAAMVSTRAIMRSDRPTTLVGVIVSGGIGTEYVVLSDCVLREHMAADQTMALTQGTAQIDALCEMGLTDPVSGGTIDPKVFAYLAVTSTATAAGVAGALKYEVQSYKKAGMIANRWVLQLRRMR